KECARAGAVDQQNAARCVRRIIQQTLISSMFFESRAHAREFARACAIVSRVLPSTSRGVRAVARLRARIHSSLSGTLLFSLRCSKWNAVRLDSRTHGATPAISIWLGGQQW